MTLVRVKKILTDLALTIKMHPLTLGMLTEDRGKFYLPEGISVDAAALKEDERTSTGLETDVRGGGGGGIQCILWRSDPYGSTCRPLLLDT